MKSKGYAKGGAKMMKAKSGKMMKAMGGKMMKSKGYAKGGAKMMKAMGGKMAKGYAKGGAKKVMTASMGMAAMRSAAKEKGYKLVKMEDSSFMKRRKNLGGLKKKKS